MAPKKEAKGGGDRGYLSIACPSDEALLRSVIITATGAPLYHILVQFFHGIGTMKYPAPAKKYSVKCAFSREIRLVKVSIPEAATSCMTGDRTEIGILWRTHTAPGWAVANRASKALVFF